jgi:hypothetical protein
VTQRLVVASVVRHSGAVLDQFLTGLERLETQGPKPSFVFIDDTVDVPAARVLAEFAQRRPGVVVISAKDALVATLFSGESVQGDSTVWRVAAMKDALLAQALTLGASHVLLIDSSLILPPPLACHLLSLGLDVISEVFWSEWQEGEPALPNVWLSDQYNFFVPELARGGGRPRICHEAARARDLPSRGPGRLHPYQQGGPRRRCIVQGSSQPHFLGGRPALQPQGNGFGVCLVG